MEAKGLMLITFIGRDCSGMITIEKRERQNKKRNKQRQCSKSAVRVRPGIWLFGIIDEYSVKDVTFSFKGDQT